MAIKALPLGFLTAKWANRKNIMDAFIAVRTFGKLAFRTNK
jgi:hypothetical protein